MNEEQLSISMVKPNPETQEPERANEMTDLLRSLQSQWSQERVELEKLADLDHGEGTNPLDFEAWLGAARHGEDPDLRSRVLAHDHLLRNMEQVIQSLSRSASASHLPAVATHKEAVAEDVEIRQQLFQKVQGLTVLQAERTALEANEETVPEELQQRIATVEQEIFTTFSRLNSSRVLIEAEDGDSQ